MIQSSTQVSSMQLGGKADQVMSLIVSWLKSGELSIGDKLPTERDLAQKFGVSLQTVNKAMSRLEDAALISRSTGRGTHVANLPGNDAIAVICDIKHLSESFHAPSTDKLLENLIDESKRRKLIPHFLVGRGKSANEYINSLGMNSSIWREIKGVISKGWREGLEEILDAKGIPLITISTKEQGRHAATFDYMELGRLAAKKLLAGTPSKLCAMHNCEIESYHWNNPIDSFKEELGKASFNSGAIVPINAGDTPRDAKIASERMESELLSSDGIFITDDNLAAGFAEWLKERKPELKPGFKTVVQANKGVELDLPESFERISFDLSEIAAKSMEALEQIRRGEIDAKEESRIWIKPHSELRMETR